MIDVRRAVKISSDAVADEDGDDAEAVLPGVLKNLGAYPSERPPRAAGFDPDVEAVLGHLSEQ